MIARNSLPCSPDVGPLCSPEEFMVNVLQCVALEQMRVNVSDVVIVNRGSVDE